MYTNIYRALALSLALLIQAAFGADLQAAPLPQSNWESYAVIAEEQILVGPNRNLNGSFLVLDPDGYFDLGTDSQQAGGLVAAQTTRLQRQSSVENLYTQTLTGSGTIRGQQLSTDFPPTNVTLPPPATPTSDCVTVAFDVDVPRNTTGEPISGRCYGNVTVRDGATLTLRAGNYQMHRLTIGKGARLQAEGAVTVRVRRSVRTQPEATIRPDSGNPSDLVFQIEARGNNNVIGRLSNVVARFVSPNDNNFRLEQFTNITGTVLANRVYMVGYHGEAPPTPTPPTPTPSFCGDGVIRGDETCDDGADNGTGNPGPNGLVCRSDCTFCGDAIQQDGEFCDEGPSNGSSKSCYANCRACGDDICQTELAVPSYRNFICFETMPTLTAQSAAQCETTLDRREAAGLDNFVIPESCDLGIFNGTLTKGPLCAGATPPIPPDPNGLYECNQCVPASSNIPCADGGLPDPALDETCRAGEPAGYWDNICRTGDPDVCTVCGDGIIQREAGEECDDTGPNCGPDCRRVPDEPGVCAPAPENIFKNRWGLEAALLADIRNTGSRRAATANPAQNVSASGQIYAGPVLNIGGEGQVALGPWYDVRANDGDAQQVLIQIRNSNTGDENLPVCNSSDYQRGTDGTLCYNPNGGILARVRFKESLQGTQAFSYSIILGCGQVWAGNLQLGSNGLPELRSGFPVVVEEDLGSWRTADAFTTPQAFTQAVPGDVKDWQTGSFEIIGVESLSCDPEDQLARLEGNRWAKPDGFLREAATNHLSAQVFLVRVGAGVSHAYRTPAIARFAARGLGPILVEGGILSNLEAPTLADCLTFRTDGERLLTPTQCVAAVNLALTSAQLSAQFDISPLVGGETRIIASLPTLNLNCAEGAPYGPGPFSCNPNGEKMRCTVADREGNTRAATLAASGLTTVDGGCRLTRATTEIAMRAEVSRSEVSEPPADISLWTDRLPRPLSGTVKMYFDRNLAGELLHGETLPDGLLNVFGRPATGYEGLPVISLTVQEYRNGRIGGTYGNTTPTGSFDKVLYPGN
ncbi:MAG: hypothetical protein P8K07_11250 [Candidatus Binatia bacterium]|nr:hypothetical protein [Candidatus Binatia bacterium]